MITAPPFSKKPIESRAAKFARASLLTGAVVVVICAPVLGRRYTLWAWFLAAALALALPALIEVKVLRSSIALLEVLFGTLMMFGWSENGVLLSNLRRCLSLPAWLHSCCEDRGSPCRAPWRLLCGNMLVAPDVRLR